MGDLRKLPDALTPLTRHPRWVLWRWEWTPKSNKWTKVPYQPDRPRLKARSNDPSTWSTYEVAVAAFGQGEADGIGYELTDGEVGAFDLDNCRDPETGVVAPWAASLTEAARSYVEVTVSGTGLRILGIARGAKIHRKDAAPRGGECSLETYRRAARFIVVTGVELPGSGSDLADIDLLIDTTVTALDVEKSERRKTTAFVESAGFSAECDEAGALPRQLLQLITEGVPEGSRSQQFHHVVGWLKQLGQTPEQIVSLMEQHPGGIASKYAGRLETEVDRCYAKTDGRASDRSASGAGGPPAIKLHWHGDPDEHAERKWLVVDAILETGKGLLAGQWGTGKTFVAIDLAAAVMVGTSFAGRKVLRRGGVLFIAAEGANEVALRLRGVVEHKLANEADLNPAKLERLPFAWIDECPSLSKPKATDILGAAISEAGVRMREQHDLPLALIVIDTLMAAADFEDENDAAQGQKVMRVLEDLSRVSGGFALAVDHFGKAVETGTRGTSAKEASADVVLALLGEKDLAGNVSNRRMAVRKLRGGATGEETPFELRQVTFDPGATFSGTTTCVAEWSSSSAGARSAVDRNRWPQSLRIFQTALLNTLVEDGRDERPFGGEGPVVRAVRVAAVRAQFSKGYPADNPDPSKSADAKRRAFERALRLAIGKQLVTTLEVRGIDHIWSNADLPTDMTSTPDRQDTH
jgi:hypothetical protein